MIYIYNLKGFNLCITCQTRHALFHDSPLLSVGCRSSSQLVAYILTLIIWCSVHLILIISIKE